MINLIRTKWTGDKSSKYDLSRPWHIDGEVIATDGNKAIVVPYEVAPDNCEFGWPESMPPDNRGLFSKWGMGFSEMWPISASSIEAFISSLPHDDIYELRHEDWEECRKCNGDGFIECPKCGHKSDCPECKGKGGFGKGPKVKVLVMKAVEFPANGSQYINVQYLDNVREVMEVAGGDWRYAAYDGVYRFRNSKGIMMIVMGMMR